MASYNHLSDPEWIRANRNGQITKEQLSDLRSRLNDLPGWFTLGIIFALMVAAIYLDGDTLSKSTPLAIAAMVIIILVTLIITSVLGNFVASLRMVSLKVQQTKGQVIYKNNQYVPVVNGRQLTPIVITLNMQPGDYVFYLLRGTRYLLSAQPAAWTTDFDGGTPAASQSSSPFPSPFASQPNPAQNMFPSPFTGAQSGVSAPVGFTSIPNPANLASPAGFPSFVDQQVQANQPALDFRGLTILNGALEQVGLRHPSSLNVNKAGKQSIGQRAGLLKVLSSNFLWAGVVAIGWVYIDYTIFLKKEWTGLLEISAFFLIVELVLLSGSRNELFDFLSGGVVVEEGQIVKSSRDITVRSRSGSHSRPHYYIQINQRTLEVSLPAYNALIEGQYRVYLMPRTNWIVNIEVL